MKTITCIIPTYNEEPRILNILSIVSSHPFVNEVLVIDDKSKDNTVNIVREFTIQNHKARLILHEKNKGKSMAIYTGIKESISEYLMFIDADLIGLNQDNLTNLIEPVLNKHADVTISLRQNAPKIWRKIGLDYISGERVISRKFLIKYIEGLTTLPRFGLESYINKYIIKEGCKIQIVNWSNVSSPYKYKKFGWWKGLYGDFFMIIDIIRTISIFGPIYQIIKMKRLVIK